jgi:non-heme chloroperoxidase
MRGLLIGGAVLGLALLAAIGTALTFVASRFPPIEEPRDVFGFTSMRRPATEIDPPSLRRFAARDGEQLAYRVYDSTADRLLIFVHGSSYHGAGYHALAAHLSLSGAAKVVLPNVRGHYQSGRHRGDVDYIGQLEDDLADLVQFLRGEGLRGPVTVGGHSSGGGLAIRFAGGPHKDLASSFLMLAPVVPRAPSVRSGTAGGWANLHFRRLYGLLALNAIGIHGFDGLPIIEFNKPAKFWDGTETLSYSYRLNMSYHPRYDYAADLKALGSNALAMVGADDEAIDPPALRDLFAANAPSARVEILPQVNHFGIFSEAAALEKMAAWLKSLPSGR